MVLLPVSPPSGSALIWHAVGPACLQWIEAGGAADKAAKCAAVMQLLEDKVLVPFSGAKYPLEQFKEAMAASTAVGRGAKLFLQG